MAPRDGGAEVEGPAEGAAAAVPAERRETVRMALARTLRGGWATAKELSRAVGLPEKEVAAHLEHLGRSGRARGERLEVEPAVCRDCGFAFRGRARLTRPGACPSCRGTHLDPPQFRLAPEEDAGG